ncbi:hypothetical protein ACFYVW_34865 [Streptomyces tendae]
MIEATRYHSSLPPEAVAQMVDEAGNVVSWIWHMHAVLRPQENRSESPV